MQKYKIVVILCFKQYILQPYSGGRSAKVLKWKPQQQNSVDFKLQIVSDVPKGVLHVDKSSEPFDEIQVKDNMFVLGIR